MHLLSSLPSSLFRTYLKSEDDDGTEGDVVMVDSSFSPQRDVLIDLLSNLLDSAFITYLLQGLEQNDFVYFGTVSSLLVALLSRLPAKKNETCNVLLFKTKIPLMTMLFETLKNGDLWERGLKRESEMTLLLGTIWLCGSIW